MLISCIKKIFITGSTGRWILTSLYGNPIKFSIALVRSLISSYKLTGKIYPVRVRLGLGQRLDLRVSRNSIVEISDYISVENWGGLTDASSIKLSDGASLKVLGVLTLGPGVHISVERNATLEFGGRKNSSGSGITCSSRIMVEKDIKIGADTIIAWGVFISDSDWHSKSWGERTDPIFIGDHVWIAHDVSIAKGVTIPAGCIVGSKSLVTKRIFPENSLIVGVPATIQRENVEWSR